MPNLNPVPDSVEHLAEQRKLIEDQAVIHVYPYGAITIGEKGETIADLEGMANNVIGFSDDGRGVQSEEMMICAMEKAKRSHYEVHCSRNEQACSHETLHVAVIGNEAIHEFSDCIDEKQGRSDYSKFTFREHFLIDERLLYHIDAQPADIV